MPSPHCIRPAPRPRAWSGHSSASIDAPVDHSEPMAMPTRKRRQRERHPVPGEGAKPGHDRIGEDRDDHGAPAADIIGQHAADQAADAPAEQGDADDGAGIGRDLRKLRRIEQLAQRHADHQDQREGLVAVEHPAEIRGNQRVPLARGRGCDTTAPIGQLPLTWIVPPSRSRFQFSRLIRPWCLRAAIFTALMISG